MLEIENIKQLKVHPLRGNLFENFVIIEFLKNRFNQAEASNLYFYRDRTGNEIDLIIQKTFSLIPVEIKSTATVNLDFCRGLNMFKKLFGKEIEKTFIIYNGYEKYTYNQTTFFPWYNLNQF